LNPLSDVQTRTLLAVLLFVWRIISPHFSFLLLISAQNRSGLLTATKLFGGCSGSWSPNSPGQNRKSSSGSVNSLPACKWFPLVSFSSSNIVNKHLLDIMVTRTKVGKCQLGSNVFLNPLVANMVTWTEHLVANFIFYFPWWPKWSQLGGLHKKDKSDAMKW